MQTGHLPTSVQPWPPSTRSVAPRSPPAAAAAAHCAPVVASWPVALLGGDAHSGGRGHLRPGERAQRGVCEHPRVHTQESKLWLSLLLPLPEVGLAHRRRGQRSRHSPAGGRPLLRRRELEAQTLGDRRGRHHQVPARRARAAGSLALPRESRHVAAGQGEPEERAAGLVGVGAGGAGRQSGHSHTRTSARAVLGAWAWAQNNEGLRPHVRQRAVHNTPKYRSPKKIGFWLLSLQRHAAPEGSCSTAHCPHRGHTITHFHAQGEPISLLLAGLRVLLVVPASQPTPAPNQNT